MFSNACQKATAAQITLNLIDSKSVGPNSSPVMTFMLVKTIEVITLYTGDKFVPFFFLETSNNLVIIRNIFIYKR